MWRALTAGAAMMAIAGTSFVYAQQGGQGDAQRRDTEQFQRWQPTAEDAAAFADARVAAARAALRLTPEQEKLWTPVEQAMREAMKLRYTRMSTMREKMWSADPVERLRVRAQAMAEGATAMQRLADAAAPLYQTLDDNQKRRIAFLMRGGMGGGGMGMMGGRGYGHRWSDDGDRGFGPGRGMGPGGGMGPGRGMGPGGGGPGQRL